MVIQIFNDPKITISNCQHGIFVYILDIILAYKKPYYLIINSYRSEKHRTRKVLNIITFFIEQLEK